MESVVLLKSEPACRPRRWSGVRLARVRTVGSVSNATLPAAGACDTGEAAWPCAGHSRSPCISASWPRDCVLLTRIPKRKALFGCWRCSGVFAQADASLAGPKEAHVTWAACGVRAPGSPWVWRCWDVRLPAGLGPRDPPRGASSPAKLTAEDYVTGHYCYFYADSTSKMTDPRYKNRYLKPQKPG